MIVAPLLVALLAVPASAQVVLPPFEAEACVRNEMTREWEKISFALWLTDYTIPDSSPRTATLRYQGCRVLRETLGEPMDAQEQRYFVSEDGKIGVIATTSTGGSDGATYLTLVTKNGNNGLTNSAQLGVWSHHRVYYKGIGVDKAKIQDWRDGGRALVTNVFVIPTGAVIDQK
jgi:hypothetical protein